MPPSTRWLLIAVFHDIHDGAKSGGSLHHPVSTHDAAFRAPSIHQSPKPPIHQPFPAAPWSTLTPSLRPTLQRLPVTSQQQRECPTCFRSDRSNRSNTSSRGLRHPRMGPLVSLAAIHSRLGLHMASHVRTPNGLVRLIWRPYDMDKRQKTKNQSGSNPDGWLARLAQ